MKKIYKVLLIILSVLVLFFVFIGIDLIEYRIAPEHKVEVTWIVYQGGHGRKYTNVFQMRGSNFRSRIDMSYGRYSNGKSVLILDGTDRWLAYVNNQGVCIYNGYSDVDIVSIKIIE